MRITEVSADPRAQRLAAMTQFLLGRTEDTASAKKISTDAYLKLAADMGISLTQSQLINLSQQPPLNSLIANIENNEIIFKGAEQAPDTMSVDQARATVDAMAKRAAKKGI